MKLRWGSFCLLDIRDQIKKLFKDQRNCMRAAKHAALSTNRTQTQLMSFECLEQTLNQEKFSTNQIRLQKKQRVTKLINRKQQKRSFQFNLFLQRHQVEQS